MIVDCGLELDLLLVETEDLSWGVSPVRSEILKNLELLSEFLLLCVFRLHIIRVDVLRAVHRAPARRY